ncbi:unnamed protein product [Dovyalis caffra]|uniref:Uncharacterized protein n=1 Tax=Dovyalis caffra TaxID=77055 RepID=A0AAV1RB15_9ROSI|nr:unnamed protein product [Dovyalis caffra]
MKRVEIVRLWEWVVFEGWLTTVDNESFKYERVRARGFKSSMKRVEIVQRWEWVVSEGWLTAVDNESFESESRDLKNFLLMGQKVRARGFKSPMKQVEIIRRWEWVVSEGWLTIVDKESFEYERVKTRGFKSSMKRVEIIRCGEWVVSEGWLTAVDNESFEYER